jgi:hypothetical protein
MIPNSRMDTPPMTGVGIELISAVILPMKPKTVAIIAAPSRT